MADVFISYSQADREHVEALEAELTSYGLTCWWDKQLTRSASFVGQIVAELEAAELVIVLWSHSSASSDWVHSEAEMARSAGKYLGVVIDWIRPPPPFLAIDYLKVLDGGFTTKFIRRLDEVFDRTRLKELAEKSRQFDLEQRAKEEERARQEALEERKKFEAKIAEETRQRKHWSTRLMGAFLLSLGGALVYYIYLNPLGRKIDGALRSLYELPIAGILFKEAGLASGLGLMFGVVLPLALIFTGGRMLLGIRA